MENTIKIQIIDTIAQYNSDGYKAIQDAYELYVNNEGVLTFEEFQEKLDLNEIDNEEFMYDSASEKWASDDEMLQYYNRTF